MTDTHGNPTNDSPPIVAEHFGVEIGGVKFLRLAIEHDVLTVEHSSGGHIAIGVLRTDGQAVLVSLDASDGPGFTVRQETAVRTIDPANATQYETL